MTTTNEEREEGQARRHFPHPRLPSISSRAVVDGLHTIAKYRDRGVRLGGRGGDRQKRDDETASSLFVCPLLSRSLALPASAGDPGGRRRGCPLQSLGGLGKTSIISRCRRRWLTVASRCLDQMRSWRKLWAECRGRRDSENPTERGKVYYILNVSNFHGSNMNVEYDTHNQYTTHILHFNYNRLPDPGPPGGRLWGAED